MEVWTRWLVLHQLILVVLAIGCTKFKCATSRLAPSHNGRQPCMQYDDTIDTTLVVPCQGTYMQCFFLPWATKEECKAKQKLDWVIYPGEACSSNDQCATSNCYNGVCKGANMDESCTANEDCDVGLACQRNGRCALVQNEGQLCDELLPCASYLHCVNYTCTRYGSLDVGVKFQTFIDKWDGFNFVCKSGAAERQSKDDPWPLKPNEALFICKEGMKLQTIIDDTCVYYDKDADKEYSKRAVCGLSWENERFCEIGNLDPEYQQTFAKLIQYLNKVKPQCSVAYSEIEPFSTLLSPNSISLARKFFCSNWQRLPEFEALKRNFSQYLFNDNYVLLNRTDSCVKTVIDSLYFRKSYVPSLAFLQTRVPPLMSLRQEGF